MTHLPDGSGFFVQTIYDKRPPGFVMWLKGRPNGSARTWLFVWRMYRDCRRMGGYGRWDSFRYALSVAG